MQLQFISFSFRGNMSVIPMPFFRLRLNEGGETFQTCYGIEVANTIPAGRTLPNARAVIARGLLPKDGVGIDTVGVRAVDHIDRYNRGFIISQEVTLRRDVIDLLCAGDQPFQDLQETPFITIEALIMLYAENIDHGEIVRRAFG